MPVATYSGPSTYLLGRNVILSAMRKLVLQLAISLDGFIEGPNGEFDWCFTDQDYGMTAFYDRIDSVFYGRKSYELQLAMADSMDTGAMPDYPKPKEYVFSTTLTELPPGVTLISGDVEKKVRQIKYDDGKDIWLFGGASLTTALMNLGLVDEICLAVHPILLGKGKPLCSGLNTRIPLQLQDCKTYTSGLLMLTYSITQ